MNYGNFPESFKIITEFPLDYWLNAIDHNGVVWVDFVKIGVPLEQLRDNYDPLDVKTKFTVNGAKYEIYSDYDYIDDYTKRKYINKIKDDFIKTEMFSRMYNFETISWAREIAQNGFRLFVESVVGYCDLDCSIGCWIL